MAVGGSVTKKNITGGSAKKSNVWGASAKKIKCVGSRPGFFPVRNPVRISNGMTRKSPPARGCSFVLAGKPEC